MEHKKRIQLQIAGIALVAAALLGGIAKGIVVQNRAAEESVNAISELRDPSPFRAALVGQLDKIHLSLQGYLRSRDQALLQQVQNGQADFEKSVPEFEKQNPRLLPLAAGDEILQDYKVFKESAKHLMEVSQERASFWTTADNNFENMLVLLDQRIRPLARKAQAEDRLERVLKIENQLRTWQQNLARAWDEATPVSQPLALENENKGEILLESAEESATIRAEKKTFKDIRSIWIANGDLQRKIFALGIVQKQSLEQANLLENRTRTTLNRLLPAMPTGELEIRKQNILKSMRRRLMTAGILGLFGIAVVIIAGVLISRTKKMPEPAPRKAAPAAPAEPTLIIDPKGTIVEWSPRAEKLYGFVTYDMVGQSVGTLFASETEIERIFQELQSAKTTDFKSIHRNKLGGHLNVRMTFRPVIREGSPAIALECHQI